MNSPAGFPGILLETSPLDGIKYLFPCQAGPLGNYVSTSTTTIQAGGTQLLNLTGSAVHGGGSCQISLAKSPSANASDWKVIHSIIGGCPATTTGNLPTIGEDAEGRPDGPHCPGAGPNYVDCVKSFNIPIPDVAAGNYVFAWSWFNNLGNREMYMNCAPVEIAGGTGSVDFDALPSIFYSDVAGEPCVRGEGLLDFPMENVGGNSSIEVSEYDIDKTNATGLGGCYRVYGTAMFKAGSFDGTSATQATLTYPLTYSTASGSSAPAETPSGLGNGTTPFSLAAPTPLSPAAATPSSLAALSVGPTPSAQPPAPYSNSTVPLPSPAGCAYPCSTQNAVVCIGTTQFGLCNYGCAVAQPLAAGTYCSGGVINKRDG